MIEVGRLLLAAVFAVAGVAKLADLAGSRRAVRDFGLPARFAPALALLLPFAELAIAAALVPSTSARFAAAGAAALLLLFVLAIGVNLSRGRRPDCHCFGKLHSAPAGWGTLARNAALAAVAIGLVTQPASNPSTLELAVAGVILAVSAQAILSVVLLRRYGKALRRIEELEVRPVPPALAVGVQAPRFDGLEELLAPRRPVLLVFSEPDCPACRLLEPQLEAWKREHADRLTISVVNGEALALYGAEATPSAVLADADGRIAHELVVGVRPIEALVESMTRTPEPARNGNGRVALAGALAGGLAVTAAVAQAAPPTDPELKAIDDVLRAAGPKLVAASQRSLKAVRAQATVKTGKPVRAKRTAARRALAAERREVLALRAKVKPLAETSPTAHNVKVMVGYSLSLLAQSLQKRERAIGASPKAALRLVDDSRKLFLRSVGSSAAAAKLLGYG